MSAPTIVARLAELTAVYDRIVERTADQFMPEGASKDAARRNRKSGVKRARQGSTIRQQARKEAENYLADLADRRPDDPTLARFSRLSRERDELLAQVSAISEYAFGGTVPRELQRLEAGPAASRLAGLTEIAGLLGVSRQRVHQLHRAGRMPAPVAELAAGPIWDLEAIEPWAAARNGSKVSL